MRNTDTTNQDKGLCPLTPAAHQTAGGRIMQFDSVELAEIVAALQMAEWEWLASAKRAERAGAEDEAATARRHAAACKRLRGKI